MARGALPGVRHWLRPRGVIVGRVVRPVSVSESRCRWGLTMAAGKFKGNRDKRDGRQFVALPRVVLESPGYRQAGHSARSLLVDIALQYTGHNNGKLVACAKYLAPLGWNSNSTSLRAVHELLSCGLLIETRKGARPNKAAWLALSWLDLDQGQGLDIDPKLYRRGDYMRPDTPAPVGGNSRTAKATEARKLTAIKKRAEKQNASLKPSNGAEGTSIAPSNGVRASILAPSDGAVRGTLAMLSTPSHGAYLEIPSTPATAGGLGSGAAFSPSLLAAVRRRTAGVA